jgi:alpha-D-ribose 1-methylphosphonate 5-triphosphate synthase subunit PhnG
MRNLTLGLTAWLCAVLLSTGCGTDSAPPASPSELPCTEQGIRDAVAQGGGPYTFDCDGDTTIVTDAPIPIDKDVVLDGEGVLTLDTEYQHGVFSVPIGVTARLIGFTLTQASGDGAIANEGTLTLDDMTIADSEGGVRNSGVLTMSGCSVLRNFGFATGGGIGNFGTLTVVDSEIAGNEAQPEGGGIYNAGQATVTRTTVRENFAFANGGGFFNTGELTITESAVANNESLADGGGIASSGTVLLTNSTVSTNTALAEAAAIVNTGTLTMTSTTVAANSGMDIDGNTFDTSDIENDGGTLTVTSSVIDGDCVGTLVSGGYNIESPGETCGFAEPTDQFNVGTVELGLEPLQDNGGDTLTHALLPTSEAVDVIPEDECGGDGSDSITDQRGVTRPQGTACDVGAFELESPP